MKTNKSKVAFWSVIAAIFLTASKLIIGIITGSLGILSEALHSALDLVAAAITLISVKISDKPADRGHHYGHGKIENLSALVETVLLLVTCVWIIYEALHRLTTGNFEIEVTVWSYVVVIGSIIIDFTRSRALYKAAKEHNSQALEADALHFSTDIWRSVVVLICVQFDIFYADAIAALLVALIVLFVSYRLGRRAIDVLLDKAPENTYAQVKSVLMAIPEITHFHDVRIRNAGPDTFIEINIHVKPDITIQAAHEISHKVENEIKQIVDRCEVHVHAEPDEIEIRQQ
jgi:cation diffusion facilitator family transporter